MFLRRNRHTNGSGLVTTYICLAHNVREKGPNGRSRTKPRVLLRLGVEERLDPAFLDFVSFLLAKTGPEAKDRAATIAKVKALLPRVQAGGSASQAPVVLEARELGLQLMLEQVWDDLGIRQALKGFQAQHRCEFDFEALVFAMVLNRLVDPQSKLACNEWAQSQAAIQGAKDWGVQHFYRAMDLLHEHWPELEEALGGAFAQAQPDEVAGLQLVDTTSLYFEADLTDREVAELNERWEAADLDDRISDPKRPRPQVVNEPALRLHGHNKDGRPDAPQVVLASVTTPSGFVMRHQVFPGNTNDQSIAKVLAQELPKLLPGQARAWVSDSGMVNATVVKTLKAAGWNFLTAAPLRKMKLVGELLSQEVGRFKQLKDKPHVGYRVVDVAPTESPSGEAERWVLIRNERERERDLAKLEKHVAAAKEAIQKKGTQGTGHAKATCEVVAHQSKGRYVMPSPKRDGAYVLDQTAIRQEQKLAGMRALRTDLLAWDGELILRSYSNQRVIEEKHRQYKSVLKLRPCHHRKADRIRAHCMLTILAANVAQRLEAATGLDLETLRKETKGFRVVRMQEGHRSYWERTEPSPRLRKAHTALGWGELPKRWEGWIQRGPSAESQESGGLQALGAS